MILVVTELDNKALSNLSLNILKKAWRVAQTTDTPLAAVAIGSDVQSAAENLVAFADKVIAIEDPALEHTNPEVYQQALQPLLEREKPVLTLVGHTSFGMELGPTLAFGLDLPVVTDCVDIEPVDGKFRLVRQVYGGKINNRVSYRGEQCIATMRSDLAAEEEDEESGSVSVGGEIERFPCTVASEKSTRRFVKYVEEPPGEVDITAADRIVAAGRGVKEKDDIEMLQELAAAIRGEVAGSKPVVDKGYLSSDRQVGSSGKTVNAKLYVAVGISGAFQHVAGMKQCDTIVAITNDAYAPILGVADYAVVGDLYKVVPAMIARFRELKEASG